jgi:hypothetical protein
MVLNTAVICNSLEEKRPFLGREVILLDFPGHVVMAVEISDNYKGNTIEFEGKHFVICDPSYLGAPLGEMIPEYRTGTAHINTILKPEETVSAEIHPQKEQEKRIWRG